MTELQLFDEGLLLGGESAKLVEVIPEMLDYEFINNCDSVDELRSILKSLRSGEYGKYPHLQDTVKEKLVELLPADERRKIAAIATNPSANDVSEERNSLSSWLGSTRPSESNASIATTCAPVRAVVNGSFGDKKDFHIRGDDTDSGPPETTFSQSDGIFRKEKLSTKEYFERWAKFDASLESDDEEESDNEQKQTVAVESLARLSLAEKKCLSGRECEKGNEYFRTNETEHAIACYSKSILLDESNVTALAKRGMVYHKLGRYEEAVVDFQTCHKKDGGKGYDRLMRKSKDRLHEAKKQHHTMKIREVDGSAEACDNEECDYIEEIFTPGAMEPQATGGTTAEPTLAVTPTMDASAKSHDNDDAPQKWSKIDITESEDSEDDEDDTTSGLRRISIDVESESESDGEDSDKLREEGNLALKNGYISQAIKLYSATLDIDPSNAACFNNLSLAYIKMNEWGKAIRCATKVLEIQPGNTKAYYRRGVAKLSQNSNNGVQEALEDFELALSLNPPKEQRSVLSKKVDTCKKLLASMTESQNQSPSATEKTARVRTYDSTALAF